MSLFDVISTSASAMTANRFWLDIIAGNIANANTTRTAEGAPYRRRMPVFQEAVRDAVFEEEEGGMAQEINMDGPMDPSATKPKGKGVNVMGVSDDPTPLKVIYSPGHPDADDQGFVIMPNVNIIREMVDMISANKAYDANVQVTNAAKSMITKALEIGK